LEKLKFKDMARYTDQELLDARNKALRKRFEYWYETKRLRLDDVIQKIKGEFFISESTIMKIIKNQGIYKPLEEKQKYVQKSIFDEIKND